VAPVDTRSLVLVAAFALRAQGGRFAGCSSCVKNKKLDDSPTFERLRRERARISTGVRCETTIRWP